MAARQSSDLCRCVGLDRPERQTRRSLTPQLRESATGPQPVDARHRIERPAARGLEPEAGAQPTDLARSQGRKTPPLPVPEQQPDLEHRRSRRLLGSDRSQTAPSLRDRHLDHQPVAVLTAGKGLPQRQQALECGCHRTGQRPQTLAEGKSDNPDQRAGGHRRHSQIPQPEEQPPLVDRLVGAAQPPPAVPERQPAHRSGLDAGNPAGRSLAPQRRVLRRQHSRPCLPEPDHNPRTAAPMAHRSQAGRQPPGGTGLAGVTTRPAQAVCEQRPDLGPVRSDRPDRPDRAGTEGHGPHRSGPVQTAEAVDAREAGPER